MVKKIALAMLSLTGMVAVSLGGVNLKNSYISSLDSGEMLVYHYQADQEFNGQITLEDDQDDIYAWNDTGVKFYSTYNESNGSDDATLDFYNQDMFLPPVLDEDLGDTDLVFPPSLGGGEDEDVFIPEVEIPEVEIPEVEDTPVFPEVDIIPPVENVVPDFDYGIVGPSDDFVTLLPSVDSESDEENNDLVPESPDDSQQDSSDDKEVIPDSGLVEIPIPTPTPTPDSGLVEIPIPTPDSGLVEIPI